MIKPRPDQIKKWIQDNIGDYKIVSNGKQIRINNPLSIDEGYHLWINAHKGVCVDHRPTYKDDVRGTFLSFVMKYRRISFKEAVKEVMGNDVNYDIPYYEDNNEEDQKIIAVELPHGFKYLTYEDDKMSIAIKNYLNNRCVSNARAYVHGIGYCVGGVVFPYYEFNEVVYWQQRSILNKSFLFPKGSNKSDFVYGLDKIDPTEPIIITESIFNALMFDNAVAIGGSEISDEQKNKLKKIGAKQIIMALDDDKAGKFGTVKAFDKMKAYFDLFYSFTGIEDSDWNDVVIDNDKDKMMKIFKKNMKKLDFQESVRLKRSL